MWRRFAASRFGKPRGTPVTLVSRLRLSILIIALLLARPAVAAEAQFQVSGVALGGYDPVSYFRQQEAARGNPEYRHRYNGSTWHFSNELHRDLFAEDPRQYAPQYGGFCAYAITQGQLVPVDPYAWTIHEGKLYLNYSTRVRAAWRANLDRYLEAAAENWEILKRFDLPLDVPAE